MDFGLFDQLEHPGDSTPISQLYREHIALAQHVEATGFIRYFKSEHHMVPLDAAPSINLYLAALSQQTTTLRLCSLVHLLPFYEPFRLFEELCMLDHLSDGRLEIGFGRGVSPAEHLLWGIDRDEARDRADEALDIILSAMRQASEADGLGSRFSYQGRFWSYDSVPLEINPVQAPHPRLWRPGTPTTAAEMGVSTIVPVPTARVEAAIASFRSAAQPGVDPSRTPLLPVMRRIFIGETDAAALDRGASAWKAFNRHLTKLMREHDLWATHDPSFGGDFEAALGSGSVVVGSAESVGAELQDLAAVPGVDEMVICASWGDLSAREYMDSVERFCSVIQPALA
jgi:alkanesulfonate monooxygenase SsuD/methylene tetrahydromethanopterin reductase-like flavin-dependent oxidoreductase (luciferase family)